MTDVAIPIVTTTAMVDNSGSQDCKARRWSSLFFGATNNGVLRRKLSTKTAIMIGLGAMAVTCMLSLAPGYAMTDGTRDGDGNRRLENGSLIEKEEQKCTIKNFTEYKKQFVQSRTNWCDEAHPDCDCTNPMQPMPPLPMPSYPAYLSSWYDTFERNKDLLVQFERDQEELEPFHQSHPLDVIMVGDSITEHWLGTDLNTPGGAWDGAAELYQGFFNYSSVENEEEGEEQQTVHEADGGRTIRGLALGIGGDQTPQVLYRLLHGEMIDTAKPKVWWILVGTNDIGAHNCSPETVLLGIIKILRMIHNYDPKSMVVVNSLFPRGANNQILQEDPVWQRMSWINNHLECFCSKHPHWAHYYNGTHVLVEPATTNNASDGSMDSMVYEGDVVVSTSRMHDPVHPNAEGYLLWGNEIVRTVRALTGTSFDQEKRQL